MRPNEQAEVQRQKTTISPNSVSVHIDMGKQNDGLSKNLTDKATQNLQKLESLANAKLFLRSLAPLPVPSTSSPKTVPSISTAATSENKTNAFNENVQNSLTPDNSFDSDVVLVEDISCNQGKYFFNIFNSFL